MSGRFLLDTNIIIRLLAGDAVVSESLKRADEVFIASIALGELYYGAHKSSRTSENLARINDYAAGNTILSIDIVTARLYGAIKNGLRKKGHPIPENDIWLAAVALQHDLILVTRDEHFDAIENLRSERWLER